MAGTAEAIGDRVEQIRKEIEASDSDWDKEKLNERLAKLSGGIAVIKVGAATEVEMKERKHRIEDAISATKAAVEEGIIPGGGAALVHAASVLDDGLGLTGDEPPASRSCARRWTSRCAGSPQNAGLEGYVVVGKVRELGSGSGLNAATGEYVDLAKAGIVDPVKVTKRGRQRRVDRGAAADHRTPGRGEAGGGGARPRRRRAPHPRARRRARPQPLS